MRSLAIVALLTLMPSCGGASARIDVSPVDAGIVDETTEQFAGCVVITTDDAGAASGYHSYWCGDESLAYMQWGWSDQSHEFSGACDGNRAATCVHGSPCVVDFMDGQFLQGGCL
jgi:hypothetical protein